MKKLDDVRRVNQNEMGIYDLVTQVIKLKMKSTLNWILWPLKQYTNSLTFSGPYFFIPFEKDD